MASDSALHRIGVPHNSLDGERIGPEPHDEGAGLRVLRARDHGNGHDTDHARPTEFERHGMMVRARMAWP